MHWAHRCLVGVAAGLRTHSRTLGRGRGRRQARMVEGIRHGRRRRSGSRHRGDDLFHLLDLEALHGGRRHAAMRARPGAPRRADHDVYSMGENPSNRRQQRADHVASSAQPFRRPAARGRGCTVLDGAGICVSHAGSDPQRRATPVDTFSDAAIYPVQQPRARTGGRNRGSRNRSALRRLSARTHSGPTWHGRHAARPANRSLWHTLALRLRRHR